MSWLTQTTDYLKRTGLFHVLIFVVVLFVSNFVWKLSVKGDQSVSADYVMLWGMNVTAFFEKLSFWVADRVYFWLDLVRDTVSIRWNVIHWESGSCTTVSWSCTAVKQSFIWCCILATSAGPWLRKLWYIPLGIVFIHIFNVLRIFSIALIIEHHPDLFNLFHTYIFRYLFYGMIFLMWLLWNEKLSIRKKG